MLSNARGVEGGNALDGLCGIRSSNRGPLRGDGEACVKVEALIGEGARLGRCLFDTCANRVPTSEDLRPTAPPLCPAMQGGCICQRGMASGAVSGRATTRIDIGLSGLLNVKA